MDQYALPSASLPPSSSCMALYGILHLRPAMCTELISWNQHAFGKFHDLVMDPLIGGNTHSCSTCISHGNGMSPGFG